MSVRSLSGFVEYLLETQKVSRSISDKVEPCLVSVVSAHDRNLVVSFVSDSFEKIVCTSVWQYSVGTFYWATWLDTARS